MIPVYAYIRVSTVKQGEKGSSLAEQRLAIEEYAKRNNLTIREWFEEQETAAKRGRTIFKKMLGLLLKGRAHGVVIHKIDRGARNLRDWADLGNLIDKGIQVYFAHEGLDMQSRGGRLAADIQAVVAADFIRNLRDEVKKGFYGRLRQGLYPLRAPIGYSDQGGGQPKLPDPVMAPLVQRAFRLYASGKYNLRTLGQEMNRLGLRNRQGGRVTRNGLSTMLNNEFYIGIIHIRRTGERFPGVHESLVKKSEFDRVQEVLRGRTKNTGVKNDFLYRKTLRCRHCSYSLIAEKQKGIIYYRCHTPECPRTCVREDYINLQVLDEIHKISMTPFEIELLQAEFAYLEVEKQSEQKNFRKSLELRLANVTERLERLADAYIDQSLDKETIDAKNHELLQEKVALRDFLNQLLHEDDPRRIRKDKFLELLKRLKLSSEQYNGSDLRDALKEATSNLQVDQKSLVVTWEKPFEVIQNRPKLVCCEPSRDTPRTFKKKPSSFTRKLWKLLHDENTDLGKSFQ